METVWWPTSVTFKVLIGEYRNDIIIGAHLYKVDMRIALGHSDSLWIQGQIVNTTCQETKNIQR